MEGGKRHYHKAAELLEQLGNIQNLNVSVASPLCFPHTSIAGSRVENMGVLHGYLLRQILQEAPGISIHCCSNTVGVYWKVMGDDWNWPDLISSSSEYPGAFPLITAFKVGENMVSISKFFLICVQDEKSH